jgi:hypothetical protein
MVPFARSVAGFFVGFITGYAIKKVIKIGAIIVGHIIAAIAYFQYQRMMPLPTCCVIFTAAMADANAAKYNPSPINKLLLKPITIDPKIMYWRSNTSRN